jgi:hypothetical protein
MDGDNITQPQQASGDKISPWKLKSFFCGLVCGLISLVMPSLLFRLTYSPSPSPLFSGLALITSNYLILGVVLCLTLFIFPSYRQSLNAARSKRMFIVRSMAFYLLGLGAAFVLLPLITATIFWSQPGAWSDV